MREKDTDTVGKSGGEATSQGVPFQKGNVNFDFLQPEQGEAGSREAVPEKEPEGEGSKRGMFFRNRSPRPLKRGQIAAWVLLGAVSSLALCWSVAYGRSFVWLLLFPVLALSLLWSVTMLALLLARPR